MASGRHDQLSAELSKQLQISMMWMAMLSQAIATRAGINVSDLLCLNVLDVQGPMPLGRLAEATAVSPGGGITSMVDRLERAGLVERCRDTTDRRLVIVRLVDRSPVLALREQLAQLGGLGGCVLGDDDQLGLLVGYLSRNNAMAPEFVARVRHGYGLPVGNREGQRRLTGG